MHLSDADRAQAMKDLAAQLMFNVEDHGGRFSLSRDSDVPTAVGGENLTLEEAEELLETWKLRGFHGG